MSVPLLGAQGNEHLSRAQGAGINPESRKRGSRIAIPSAGSPSRELGRFGMI